MDGLHRLTTQVAVRVILKLMSVSSLRRLAPVQQCQPNEELHVHQGPGFAQLFSRRHALLAEEERSIHGRRRILLIVGPLPYQSVRRVYGKPNLLNSAPKVDVLLQSKHRQGATDVANPAIPDQGIADRP
jgi:hypothetical protein